MSRTKITSQLSFDVNEPLSAKSHRQRLRRECCDYYYWGPGIAERFPAFHVNIVLHIRLRAVNDGSAPRFFIRLHSSAF